MVSSLIVLQKAQRKNMILKLFNKFKSKIQVTFRVSLQVSVLPCTKLISLTATGQHNQVLLYVKFSAVLKGTAACHCGL